MSCNFCPDFEAALPTEHGPLERPFSFSGLVLVPQVRLLDLEAPWARSSGAVDPQPGRQVVRPLKIE
jgi:hypothetical protein